LRRERDLGAIVGDSFNLYFVHLGPLAAIVFPAAVTSLALSLLAVAISDEVVVTLILIVSVIAQFLVFEFVRSAGVVYLDSFDRRVTITSAEALDQAQQRLGIISSAAVRSTFIVLALAITIVGIPWAIMRLVRWAFLSQAIMLEEKQGEEVLAASAALVQGYWWSTAGKLLVTGIVVGLPTVVVSGIANAALPDVIAAFVDTALVFVTAPYGIISTTLMYFDLKSRKARHDNVNTA
jgi:hypothetical protein